MPKLQHRPGRRTSLLLTLAPRGVVQSDLMTGELRHPPANGMPMACRPAVVDHLALVDLVGAPSGDAIRLDAVLRDEIGGIPFDQGYGLAAAPAPARDPREQCEK